MNRHAIVTGSKSSFNLVPLSTCNAAMRLLLDTPHLRPYTVGLRARCWRARVEAMLLGNAGGAADMCRRALGEEDEVDWSARLVWLVVLVIDLSYTTIHVSSTQVTAGDRYYLEWKLRALELGGGGGGGAGLPREPADEDGALCPKQVIRCVYVGGDLCWVLSVFGDGTADTFWVYVTLLF